MSTSGESRIRTVEQAGAYLEGLINLERKPSFSYERLDLEPIRVLLAEVGHPERDLSIIHVAGSKGKGSVCLLAESILDAAGLRVGTFTSPHLERWTERFRIARSEVQGPLLAAVVERLRPHVDALRRDRPETAPSFFDATTAAALMLFAQEAAEHVLLEVGLGGRLDSTNVVEPKVTCVTSIELEHTEKLGDTVAAIAGEKAGIVKPGVPCVSGQLPADAAAIVRERTAALAAPLYELGSDFSVEGRVAAGGDGTSLTYSEKDGFAFDVELRVLGRHQQANAAIAIAAVRRLGALDDAALVEAAQRGLPRAHLPARLEILERAPLVLVDAAHTAASARSLAEVLRAEAAADCQLVLSVSGDKNVEAVLDALLPCADTLWVTRAEPIRSADPAWLAAVAAERAPGLAIEVEPDPRAAVRRARAATRADGALCCAGSVYLAGIARGELLRSIGEGKPAGG